MEDLRSEHYGQVTLSRNLIFPPRLVRRRLRIRLPHHHKPRSAQMPHQPVRRDPGHHFVGVGNPLASLVPQRKRDAVGNLLGRRRTQFTLFVHLTPAQKNPCRNQRMSPVSESLPLPRRNSQKRRPSSSSTRK